MKIEEAILADGSKLPYVVEDNPPSGGMKYTYFAPDNSYVVQFFHEPDRADSMHTRQRIQAIIGKYNPTKSEAEGGAIGNQEKYAEYFSKYFCWPLAIVEKPQFGIVCPAYPENFIFDDRDSAYMDVGGRDKRSNWFTSKNRKFLHPKTLGDFGSMLQISVSLARAVRRMHQAGLAHSDLSNNNVLIDPENGSCVIIDIDTLVVPGIFPPQVIGTRGYMAPEVLTTVHLPYDDPNRKGASSYSDLHALAVLLYEYLMLRHPMLGPKPYSSKSEEEDDYLALGPQATFIEDPTDTSNRPPNLHSTIKDLGPMLEALFLQAFVDGLHRPNQRPTALEWERALVKTWDLLYPCDNSNCDHQYFVLYHTDTPICPFCGTRIRHKEIVQFRFYTESRSRKGQWLHYWTMNIYDGVPLHLWHIQSNVFPDEKADLTLQAYVKHKDDKWVLFNQEVEGMETPSGQLLPKNETTVLSDGDSFLTTRNQGGMLVSVSIKKT